MRNEREPPYCYNCQRMLVADGLPKKCQAFPAGIPAEIWDNRADHRKPFPGDGGKQFVAINDRIPFPDIEGDADPNAARGVIE